jgi:hypothetical protein
VHNHEHRGSGSRPKAGAWLTPQDYAVALKLALEWRQQWRDEVGARDAVNGRPAGDGAKRPTRQHAGKADDRAAFAAGIARAEFGRFYWDANKNRLAANGRKPRPAKK